MRRLYFLFAFFTLCNFIIFAQDRLSGCYYSESGSYVEIKDDTFKLVMPNNAMNGFYSEVLAEGAIKYIDSSFIELNSLISPINKALGTLEVNQSKQQAVNDSIKVVFFIPYKRENLKIIIYTDNFKTFKFSYSDYERGIFIPKEIRSFSFTIEPESIINHNFDGLHYGITSLNSLDYNIEKETNLIEINIPALDDSFFEKYYVKGDYARLVNQGIIWKGEVYKQMK